MICLGIDPGVTNIGMALMERRVNGWRILDLPPTLNLCQAFDYLCLSSLQLNMIAYERQFAQAKHGHGSMMLRDIIGAARYVARSKKIPCIEVSPQTWRKAISGSGKSTKEQCRDWLKRRVLNFPTGIVGLNRSDAICIAITGSGLPARAVSSAEALASLDPKLRAVLERHL